MSNRATFTAGPFGPISTKIGTIVGVHDVIIQSKFGFNILRGFRSTGGLNFRFPIDFAGHRYNSAAATAQPVINDERRDVCINITLCYSMSMCSVTVGVFECVLVIIIDS